MGKKIKKSIQHALQYIFIIGVSSVTEIILLILSVVSSTTAYIKKDIAWLVLTLVVCLISLLFLIAKLAHDHNRKCIFEGLTRKNRTTSLRMLLTYDFYKSAPSISTDGFACSNMCANSATYTYRVQPGTDGNYDLECNLSFIFPDKQKQSDFNIMILQPRGTGAPSLRYQCIHAHNSTQTPASVDTISFEDNRGVGFSGLMIGRIHVSEGTKELHVSYVLKNSYEIKRDGVIIIFPRFYVKELDSLDISLDCSALNKPLRPNSIYVESSPCDGSTKTIQKILNLSCSPDRDTWTGTISGRQCKANCLYVLGIHALDKQ